MVEKKPSCDSCSREFNDGDVVADTWLGKFHMYFGKTPGTSYPQKSCYSQESRPRAYFTSIINKLGLSFDLEVFHEGKFHEFRDIHGIKKLKKIIEDENLSYGLNKNNNGTKIVGDLEILFEK